MSSFDYALLQQTLNEQRALLAAARKVIAFDRLSKDSGASVRDLQATWAEAIKDTIAAVELVDR